MNRTFYAVVALVAYATTLTVRLVNSRAVPSKCVERALSPAGYGAAYCGTFWTTWTLADAVFVAAVAVFLTAVVAASTRVIANRDGGGPA